LADNVKSVVAIVTANEILLSSNSFMEITQQADFEILQSAQIVWAFAPKVRKVSKKTKQVALRQATCLWLEISG